MILFPFFLVLGAACVTAIPAESRHGFRVASNADDLRHSTRWNSIDKRHLRKLRKRWTQSLQAKGLQASFGAFEATSAPAALQIVDDAIELVSAEGTAPTQRLIDFLFDDSAAEALTTPSIPSSESVEYLPSITRPPPKMPGFGFAEVRNVKNTVFLMPINYGGDDYMSVLDTGSSDTWLVGEGYRCISRGRFKREVAQSKCQFARPYRKTATYTRMPDRHFNIKYIDGEFLNGTMATETVTLGHVTVTNQEVGIIENASWMGDGVSSGLIGLAFPSVTKGFRGAANVPGARDRAEVVPYNPIFTSMWTKGLVQPIFSIALNRANEPPGLIALGGIPGLPIRYSDQWASAPLEYMNINGVPVNFADAAAGRPVDFQLYMITVDGFTVQSPMGTRQRSGKTMRSLTKQQVIVDSGTTITYLPQDISEAVNKMWYPPAQYDSKTRQHKVSCDATPPKIALMVNGTAISFGGPDMIIPWGKGECISGIQNASGTGGIAILGGVFLKSVVAVFDIGGATMRFSNRIR